MWTDVACGPSSHHQERARPILRRTCRRDSAFSSWSHWPMAIQRTKCPNVSGAMPDGLGPCAQVSPWNLFLNSDENNSKANQRRSLQLDGCSASSHWEIANVAWCVMPLSCNVTGTLA